jgi:integrase
VGRSKEKKRHLPPRLRHEHGTYFYADNRGGRKPWLNLGHDYASAIVRYGQLEAASIDRRDFAALVVKYKAEALPKLAEETQKVYTSLLKKPLEVFGAVQPADIEQQDAYRYMDERKIASARQEVAAISAVLTFGVMKGWLKANPLRGMKFGPQKRRKHYIEDDALAGILNRASPELAQAVRLIHYTALRTCDARRLRWSDWKADGLHIAISKTKSALILSRTPELEALMADLRQRRIGSMYIIADLQGRAWTYDRLYEAWQAAKPGEANLHDLRRKRLTDLARSRGVDFAQSLAAHSDPKMTQSYVSGAAKVTL